LTNSSEMNHSTHSTLRIPAKKTFRLAEPSEFWPNEPFWAQNHPNMSYAYDFLRSWREIRSFVAQIANLCLAFTLKLEQFSKLFYELRKS
ncbi:MAG: hypothetical protein KDI79_17660, partial [Anaerolineae bacterium]|nr:hypothetical protein [Anaerolineae bacterium]